MGEKENSLIKKILTGFLILLGINFVLRTIFDFDNFNLKVISDVIMFLIALTVFIGSILEKNLYKILGSIIFLFFIVALIFFI
ncbi:hypothetical protein [Macrococcus brunensis]|uniref:hypothetical protein n=1 Tax=Macrococcus brunensis TaxID=198483 RepID=UPI001EF01FF6|nr:hypothetical protein [Macrococcus brunensis]ULG73161.1 hypothetical protein MGG12_11985 [Macrococcus brunensis]